MSPNRFEISLSVGWHMEKVQLKGLAWHGSETERIRERKEFSLGDSWVKSASVFACLFRIKETFKLVRLSYTSKDKHSHYCADISLSPCFSSSLPLRALEDCTQTPRNKLGGPGTTHGAGFHLLFSPASSVIPNILVWPLLIFNLYWLFIILLFLLFRMFFAQLAKSCMPTLPHVSSSTLAAFHFWFV